MKATLAAFLFFVLASATVSAQDTTLIGGKAKIVQATEQQKEAAGKNAQSLIRTVSAGDSVFNSFLMIGTQLWNKLSAVPEFRDIENGNLSFKIPDLQPDNSWKKTITSPGKLIQDETDFKKIWSWIYE